MGIEYLVGYRMKLNLAIAAQLRWLFYFQSSSKEPRKLQGVKKRDQPLNKPLAVAQVFPYWYLCLYHRGHIWLLLSSGNTFRVKIANSTNTMDFAWQTWQRNNTFICSSSMWDEMHSFIDKL
jgi:hypothetical protein